MLENGLDFKSLPLYGSERERLDGGVNVLNKMLAIPFHLLCGSNAQMEIHMHPIKKNFNSILRGNVLNIFVSNSSC